jgi:rubrerythrin
MSADKVKKPARQKARAPRAAGAALPKRPVARADAAEAEFWTRAWAMEVEAVERYSMLADAMEQHNNVEVTELFRKLARIEQLHADRILEENPGMRPPELPAGGLRWDTAEGPETADPGDLHYRMQPYHALQIALGCEQRARNFFTRIARSAVSLAVRKSAREMADEEAEHVGLIEDWLKRTPVPRKDWEHDPDPPVQSD